jgi:hypothetical protein
VVGLCSNADKLDARATDPKTRPSPRHQPRPGVPRHFSENFRLFRRRREMAAALL